MPTRMFWRLFDEIDRLRAEELMDEMPVHLVAMGGGAKELYGRLQRRLGEPFVYEAAGTLTDDARAALRRRFG